MRMPAWTLLFLLPFLTSCDRVRIVEKPVIHEVVKVEWRDVPADLTQPCDKAEIPPQMTYGEALEGWAKDRASIDACNGKLAGIESLGAGDEQGTD